MKDVVVGCRVLWCSPALHWSFSAGAQTASTWYNWAIQETSEEVSHTPEFRVLVWNPDRMTSMPDCPYDYA